MQVTDVTQRGFLNFVPVTNPGYGTVYTPRGEYSYRDKFSRDKRSGKKPKPPKVKLTPMTRETIRVSNTPMSPTVIPASFSGSVKFLVVGDLATACSTVKNKPFDTVLTTYDYSKYVNACLIQAHNQALEPDFDTPVFVAELRETLSMLRHPFRDLLKFMRRRKSIKSIVSMASNHWLMYRYGVKPLLADIDSIISVNERSHHRYANILRKSSDYQVLPVSDVVSTEGFVPLGGLQVKSWIRTKVDITVTCSRYYNWNKTRYRSLLGDLSLPGIMGVAWELIPYSFVADWFFNVGDWISTFKSDPRINHRGYTATIATIWHRKHVTDRIRYNTTDSRVGWTNIATPSVYQIDVERKTRLTNLSLPAWPVCNWDFQDIKHLADGLTLSFQKLIGKRS